MTGRRTLRLAVVVAALLVPVLALAAEEGGAHGPDWKELGSQTVNFFVYLALIVMLAKKPALAFFQARREGVTAAIDASERAMRDAHARLEETKRKMDAFDAEREAILAEFRHLGESERRRIVAAAEVDAAKIVRDAEQAAERELKLARAALETRMVDQALSQAKRELASELTTSRQSQLIDNGIAALTGAAR